MFALDFYENEIFVKKKIIEQATTIIGNSNDTKNIMLAIKSIESLENVDRFPEFSIALETLISKITNMDLTNSTGEDLALLSRAMKLRDIPVGKEERWAQLTLDEKNTDIQGDIIIGDRTLESFDDKILEQFYSNAR